MVVSVKHFYSKLTVVMQQLVYHLLAIVTEPKWPVLLLA
jgi:hypothetical protein